MEGMERLDSADAGITFILGLIQTPSIHLQTLHFVAKPSILHARLFTGCGPRGISNKLSFDFLVHSSTGLSHLTGP